MVFTSTLSLTYSFIHIKSYIEEFGLRNFTADVLSNICAPFVMNVSLLRYLCRALLTRNTIDLASDTTRLLIHSSHSSDMQNVFTV